MILGFYIFFVFSCFDYFEWMGEVDWVFCYRDMKIIGDFIILV